MSSERKAKSGYICYACKNGNHHLCASNLNPDKVCTCDKIWHVELKDGWIERFKGTVPDKLEQRAREVAAIFIYGHGGNIGCSTAACKNSPYAMGDYICGVCQLTKLTIAALRQAVEDEREACAVEVESHYQNDHTLTTIIAAAIRARGQK